MDPYDVAGLDDCTAPLGDEQRESLHDFWDRVIREEWVPAARPQPRAVSLAELDERRERRSARRAVAQIAAASRVTHLRRSSPAARSGGFGPGEAA
jgi:hypothetical protein